MSKLPAMRRSVDQWEVYATQRNGNKVEVTVVHWVEEGLHPNVCISPGLWKPTLLEKLTFRVSRESLKPLRSAALKMHSDPLAQPFKKALGQMVINRFEDSLFSHESNIPARPLMELVK